MGHKVMTRVLVCGGRNYSDRARLTTVLNEIDNDCRIDYIISGGASGADTLAYHWALDNGRGAWQYHADWKTHGRAAGPIRNQRMLDEGKPDLVVAFPGGRGTDDMVGRAKAAGIEVTEVKP